VEAIMASWKDHKAGADGDLDDKIRRLRLLIIDDEENILESLTEVLGDTFEILTAHSADEAREVFDRENPELLLSDQRMPGMTGIDFLKEIQEREPGSIRMLITGYSDIDTVIEAVNHQVLYRYVTKPWKNEDLREVVLAGARKWLEDAGIEGETRRLYF
jgi:two-component system, NtrC family, response regulator HupR/HoxA